MANIKSQKKRIEIAERNRQANASFKSKMRHAIKDCNVAIEAGNVDEAKKLYIEASSLIDKSVKEGIQHINTASRQKSALSIKINDLTAAATETK
ncbi:MAG: 30S ribosomal protein S20 [Bacilli bacterium]